MTQSKDVKVKLCQICGKPLTNWRMTKFCCIKCRRRSQTIKSREYRKLWQRARSDAKASIPSEDKKQCHVCGKWYVQVCSHAYLRHGITEEEYKKEFGLDKKRGVIPGWYRELKREKNKGIDNLKAGAPYRFVLGDKQAGRYERRPQTLARLKQQSFIKKEIEV